MNGIKSVWRGGGGGVEAGDMGGAWGAVHLPHKDHGVVRREKGGEGSTRLCFRGLQTTQ